MGLRQENAELRRRLEQNSSNSSKPPSSDGLGKKARVLGSLRGRSCKKSGGQAGRKGDTLRATATPDAVERHTTRNCARCQAALSEAMAAGSGHLAAQVFDLPAPRLEVTEHQASIYRCAGCSRTTKAAFPDGVAAFVQYGPRLRAAAVYLNAQQLIPEDRVCQTLADLFATASLCPASVAAWAARAAGRLGTVAAHIAGRVAGAAVRHLDETGFRVGGKTCWLHTAATDRFTEYRVSRTRGDVPLACDNGVVVHDHFRSYWRLAKAGHALCNAHHLRELRALSDAGETWAQTMSDLLLATNIAVRTARDAGATALSEPDMLSLIAAYDAILARGLAWHEQQRPLARQPGARKPGARGRAPRRDSHNLLIRLRDYQLDVLQFAANFAVLFANNQAEQDLRMMKVKMNISGGFRTQDGAAIFAILRPVTSTARKPSLNILEALTTPPGDLIAKLAG